MVVKGSQRRWSPQGADSRMRRLRKRTMVDYLVMMRWIPVVFVVLPLSFLLHTICYLQQLWCSRLSYADRRQTHDRNVMMVIRRLRQRNPERDGLVCTARKQWVTAGTRGMEYKRARHFEVDLSAFCNILSIDAARMVARVEPLVTMGQITRATVPLGLSLAVVPELDDLTIGGLINAYGIEGSSHIHGLFSDTIISYEIVLGDGRLVRATADNEYSDLFHAVPWSQGTLGLLIAAEIRLIHIKEYMRLRYTPVRGTLREISEAYISSFTSPYADDTAMNAVVNTIEQAKEKLAVPDFVETLIFSPTEAVCMTGRYASAKEAKQKGNVVNKQGLWFKPWFYQHAQAALEKGEFVEYIPTRDYYHRHTRSYFWEVKLLLPFGDQPWFRWLFGWMMPPKIPLLKITEAPAIREYYHQNHVMQDLLVPLHRVADALEFMHTEVEVYPIWLCPHKVFKSPFKTMLQPEQNYEKQMGKGDTADAQMFTDVGLYNTPAAIMRHEEFDGIKACKRIEKWLIDNHGYQALYTVTELSEEDFWRMFDKTLYNDCRRKYKAVGTFMSVYYKTKKGIKSAKDVQTEEQTALTD
ncbi:hypothetical protein KP509_12G029600 [Ceratopteris richardii]|uniref:Delta(24)-sterol reductase n=1 Tax=Ceratopteris richardii TaxID=49495 RepID=A0A8T2TMC8_CERRI|nr:hypothetical protein KP509_12G029600 [Ceratopteris richardii]KAH7422867.1 hypothetical protein KP509_12G029600 [Ceratopteris richardii]